MAFHVACPITCKRICFCTLGFPQKLQSQKAKNGFLEEVAKVAEFWRDPWLLRVRERSTVQVAVPRIVVPPPLPVTVDGFGGDGEEALSAQTKRAAMQKKAAAASLEAEDYARRFESGDLVDGSREHAGEEHGHPTGNVMCRICFSGENEGSERARKMLSCKSCGKKYHRSCLKTWAQHRDLFHWSSWTCPSCRICEVCRRTGDPNKFMFCKRCDAAYHCYCQQPPHKNVSSGPYLCPKHTRCHSCGSNVPGNGLSTRWFLGYTCCDACGRLFVKGNYCPVCLKVYRDSESTPMVCCDVCQRWVHCQCDGISDEKYLQFQVDNNLQYRCATCRGECYQVKDLEDAVQELWRRRDEIDKDLIASLRAAAGLPTQEEIFSISPYSDDEENVPTILKAEYGRSLKFSLKGLVDKSPKKTKEFGKKSSKKKYPKKKGYQTSLVGKTEPHHYSLGDDKNYDDSASPIATEGMCSINQPGVLKHKFIDEIAGSNEDKKSRVVQIKNNSSNNNNRHDLDGGEDSGKQTGKSKIVKGTKLVIHLGARSKAVTTSPKSEASSCQKEQDLTTSNGSEDGSQQRKSEKYVKDGHDGPAKVGSKGDIVDYSDQSNGSKHRGREGNVIKLGKVRLEVSDSKPKRYESVPSENSRVLLGKTSMGESTIGEGNENNHSQTPAFPNSHPRDTKPLLKLKFKNPYLENQSAWVPHSEEEKSSVKGQRSKRKRPEKNLVKEDEEVANLHQDSSINNDFMDANWIIQKLGKDAVGKRVEVHQQSDNSWHKGMITDVIEGSSKISVDLEDGRSKTLDLANQGVRFVSQKQKRSKTVHV